MSSTNSNKQQTVARVTLIDHRQHDSAAGRIRFLTAADQRKAGSAKWTQGLLPASPSRRARTYRWLRPRGPATVGEMTTLWGNQVQKGPPDRSSQVIHPMIRMTVRQSPTRRTHTRPVRASSALTPPALIAGFVRPLSESRNHELIRFRTPDLRIKMYARDPRKAMV